MKRVPWLAFRTLHCHQAGVAERGGAVAGALGGGEAECAGSPPGCTSVPARTSRNRCSPRAASPLGELIRSTSSSECSSFQRLLKDAWPSGLVVLAMPAGSRVHLERRVDCRQIARRRRRRRNSAPGRTERSGPAGVPCPSRWPRCCRCWARCCPAPRPDCGRSGSTSAPASAPARATAWSGRSRNRRAGRPGWAAGPVGKTMPLMVSGLKAGGSDPRHHLEVEGVGVAGGAGQQDEDHVLRGILGGHRGAGGHRRPWRTARQRNAPPTPAPRISKKRRRVQWGRLKKVWWVQRNFFRSRLIFSCSLLMSPSALSS